LIFHDLKPQCAQAIPSAPEVTTDLLWMATSYLPGVADYCRKIAVALNDQRSKREIAVIANYG
jgi:hypothetical protein